jgi:poly-gamma-glutamate synthesis protein (capsule biosynthesis protein)
MSSINLIKTNSYEKTSDCLRIFLGGDVMTGRAIDQLFHTHNADGFGKPKDIPAQQYLVASAKLNGAEILPLSHDYIWGVALSILDNANVDLRLVNLETAITTAAAWDKKAFNFRMHPANVGCLTAARIDCCALANNHVLDFGISGMEDTINTLTRAGIGHSGAGVNLDAAQKPYIHVLPDGQRVLIFAWGFQDSHIHFPHWKAEERKPGINYLPDISKTSAEQMKATIKAFSQPGDITIASLHWGANWVKKIPNSHRAMARFLIDEAGVNIIHGHSSHHVLSLDVYHGRPIFYGCGDLINDSEGSPISRSMYGYLGALFFVDLEVGTHKMRGLRIEPLQRRRFRLESPSAEDAAWVRKRVFGSDAYNAIEIKY